MNLKMARVGHLFAQNLTDHLLEALQRPDLGVVAGGRQIGFDPALEIAFRVELTGAVTLGRPAGRSARLGAFHLRHALELAILREAAPAACRALCLLLAARCGAVFYGLDAGADHGPVPDAPWVGPMAAPQPPDAASLPGLVQVLSVGLAGGAAAFDVRAVHGALCDAWPYLGPVEALMACGGDARLSINVATGLNHYGCSHRPRPWAVTFASSTASSVSERGYGGAESARRALLRAGLQGAWATATAALARQARAGIARHFGLHGTQQVILSPSGTDCELYALALAQRAGVPVTNILVAPEETGSGVPLAAAGRHFADGTALGVPVGKGTLLEGFAPDTRLISVAIRDSAGQPRDADAIDAECIALIQQELAAGRHVLMHRLDVSKTGILAPGLMALDRFGDRIDVVVDACQTRLDPQRVRDYLARGWMVMVTGSKFFTGPPFAGAMLLPVTRAHALGAASLPAGLSAYAAEGEWPEGADLGPVARDNPGLVMRWHAACAEMEALSALPRAVVAARLEHFIGAVRAELASRAALRLIEPPRPMRPPISDAWDTKPTILAFLIAHVGDGFVPLDLAQARQLYRWLNTDLSGLVPDAAGLAGLLCHIGQPVPVSHPALGGRPAGALRLSAGARLVSGEPSHFGMDPAARLQREIADAGRVLDKIALIVQHWPTLAAADPEPRFAPLDPQQDHPG